MTLSYNDKMEITKILNFVGTDEELLEIVNEMIEVYYHEIGNFNSVSEFVEQFQSGDIDILKITNSISKLIDENKTSNIDDLEKLENMEIENFDLDDKPNQIEVEVSIVEDQVQDISTNQIESFDNESPQSDSLESLNNTQYNGEEHDEFSKHYNNSEFLLHENEQEELKKEDTTKSPKKLNLSLDSGETISITTSISYYVGLLFIPIVLLIPIVLGMFSIQFNYIFAALTIFLFLVVNVIAKLKKEFSMVFGASLFLIIIDLIVLIAKNYMTFINLDAILVGGFSIMLFALVFIVVLFFMFNLYMIATLVSNLSVWRIKLALAKGFKPEDEHKTANIIYRAQQIKFPVWLIK